MYSAQLRRILGQIEPTTRAHFRGVFAIDELSQTTCEPGSYVINFDRSDEPGSHWVAVYIDPTKAFASTEDMSSQHMSSPSRQLCPVTVEYFDSYGLAPSSPELIAFLNRCTSRYCHRKIKQRRHCLHSHLYCDKGQNNEDAAAASRTTTTVPTAATFVTSKRPCLWYNSVGLQPIFTGSCGFYCVYFILHRAMGQAAEDIIQLLLRIDSHYYVKSYVLSRFSLAFH